MNRHTYRGKRIDNGEWVFGNVLDGDKAATILPQKGSLEQPESLIGWDVDPDTIGQFTGLTLNGEEVFEGDYMEIQFHDYYCDENITIDEGTGEYIGTLNMKNFMWCVDDIPLANIIDDHGIRVIGTIHDQEEN